MYTIDKVLVSIWINLNYLLFLSLSPLIVVDPVWVRIIRPNINASNPGRYTPTTTTYLWCGAIGEIQ